MPTASLQVFEELTFCGRERKVFRYFQSRGVVHKLRHASGTRAIKRNSMAEEGVNNLNQRFLTQADTQQIADELCVIQFSEKTYICMNLVAREGLSARHIRINNNNDIRVQLYLIIPQIIPKNSDHFRHPCPPFDELPVNL